MSATPLSDIELIARDRSDIEAVPLAPSISALLAAQALAHADRPFLQEIDANGRRFTYREFDIFVNRIALALAGQGIKPGTHVAIALPNGAEIVGIWIALARLGAVAVGVNPGLTPNELDYILASSDAAFLVIHAERTDWLEDWSALGLPLSNLIVVGAGETAPVGQSFEALLDQAKGDAVLPPPDIDAPASILYTSGSSGRPKPALLPNRWHVTMGLVRSRQGPAVSRVLIENPIYYMGGQWRMAMAMTQGGCVYVARRPTINGFAERIAAHGIEFSSLSNLIGKDPNFTLSGGAPTLKWLASCALPKDLHERAEALLKAPVREIYGSTEMGSCIVMPVAATAMIGSGSVGRPAAFRECRIVSATGEEVAQGQTGELQVRGPGMLMSYHNASEANADAFTNGWFRTGDLFRQDSDGYFYWIARAKDIIRRSNENISAAEIEDEIIRIPGVLEVAALPVPDDYRGEEVKVYVRLQPGLSRDDLLPAAILEHCRDRLAAFKLPRYVEYVDEFPRTVSLKISKPDLRRAKPDLRRDSFDLVDGQWR